MTRFSTSICFLALLLTLSLTLSAIVPNINFNHSVNISEHTIPTPVLPTCTITPSEKYFGRTVINTETDPQTFTISNSGIGTLGIVFISIIGENADQFVLTNTNPPQFDIAAGNSAIVSVTFHPASVGAKTAILVITDNLTRTAHQVALSGEGFDPTITIPHTQNFDAQTTSALPEGWIAYNSHTESDARPWYVEHNAVIGAVSPPNVVAVSYHPDYPKDDWMVTPAVSLNAGITYVVKFMVKAPGFEIMGESMTLKVSNSQSLASLSAGSTLWQDFNLISSSFTQKIAHFTPATSGNYYFGWHACSIADLYYIAIDNITFEEGLILNSPTNLTALAGDAVVHLSWAAPEPGSTGTFSGYKLYRNQIPVTVDPITATEYTDHNVVNGNTYEYCVSALYTNPEGESNASNLVSATPYTATSLFPPQNLNASVSGANVTLNWDAAGPDGTWITHSGNYVSGIGFNTSANFHVAHRYTPSQLSALGVSCGQLLKVKFVPHVANAVYTVKVWTGGSANPYNPGTEVASKLVSVINLDDWTEVILSSPVTIPPNTELWIGYNVDTPSGYPAGADNGPQLDGFGNMIFFQNQWTSLSTLSPTATRNWCIQGFATTPAGQIAKIEMPVVSESDKAIVEFKPVNDNQILQVVTATQNSQNRSVNRNLLGYNVYRGTTLLTPTPLPATMLTYQDNNVANGDYLYAVTALYTEGESEPATAFVTVNTDFVINQFPWEEGFEGTFLPYGWTNIDNDGDSYKWMEYAEAGATIHGTKCVASASYMNNVGALTPDNWLISPKIDLPAYNSYMPAILKFWIAAQDPEWPQEHYSVMISTSNSNLASFTSLFSETLTSGDWTPKTIPLENYSNQNIYIAFRHHDITDMFMLKLDEVMIEFPYSADITPIFTTRLSQNYPNPFNPATTIEFSVKESSPVTLAIFNVKGQKVRTLVNEVMTAGKHSIVWNGKDEAGKDAGSGIYFYKMSTPNYSASQKMILMK